MGMRGRVRDGFPVAAGYRQLHHRLVDPLGLLLLQTRDVQFPLPNADAPGFLDEARNKLRPHPAKYIEWVDLAVEAGAEEDEELEEVAETTASDS